MLTSKLNLPLPGGWSKDSGDNTPGDDLAAGVVGETGQILDQAGKPVAKVTEGDPKGLIGSVVAPTGEIIDGSGNVVGKAAPLSEEEQNAAPTQPEQKKGGVDLKGIANNVKGAYDTFNKIPGAGNLVGQVGKGLGFGGQNGQATEGGQEKGDVQDVSEPLDGKVKETADAEAPQVDDAKPDTSQVDGAADDAEGGAPIHMEDKAQVNGDDQQKEEPVDGEQEKAETTDGDQDKKDEQADGEQAEQEDTPDYSVLKDCKINKAGNIVDANGRVVGRVVEGKVKDLVGRKADKNGDIWNDSGKVVGKAEPVEPEEAKEPAPFEDFPDAVVESNGTVTFEGNVIGRVIEGDAKKLKGKKVDEDGDILDRAGNALGKAERWEEEEPEPEPEEVVDNSALAGKRVNKIGNVVDTNGTIFGRLVEGDPKRLAGRMCDKDGNVRSESGDVIGRAELVSEGEREGVKDGPFAELPGCTVTKDGKVATSSGDIVGRLVQGDGKVLYGRAVDEDGDVLDKNGNTIGKAERWEEPEEEVPQNPMKGRKVNREGNVVDADGNVIGKLTSGELTICAGKQIDNDGDVVDYKGNTVGHASLLEDIPPEPEPEESPEDKQKREQAEEDEKLAKRMAACLEGCLDKINPICRMITEKIDKADRTPKDELDEEELVKEVRPLIEEGHKILQEANGIIRGLDPDGHIQANAKHKTASREASPAEYHLADKLKELTGTVSETIDGAKRKIQDMPHAKKELNPLWGLLTEPLGQIIAAVGLLLNGVLELVGRLLNGLGLGGLVNNLLGGLGLTNVLKSLGVGSVVDSLTGQKGKK